MPHETKVPESEAVSADRPEMTTVLLVDDSPSIIASLERALASEGFAVTTARSGAEAEDLFAADRPDLVLLDLNMPGENGWNTFERMSRSAPEVPIIIVTALPDQFDFAQAAGVGALVEKPVEIPELLRVMRETLAEDVTTRLARLVDRSPSTRRAPPSGNR